MSPHVTGACSVVGATLCSEWLLVRSEQTRWLHVDVVASLSNAPGSHQLFGNERYYLAFNFNHRVLRVITNKDM